jgi:hypothetical protein
VRFENFDKLPGQDVTLSQETAVHPSRCYRLSCSIKSEDMVSSDPFGSGYFRLDVVGVGDDRRLQYENPKLHKTADWYRVAVGFNTWGYDKVRILATVEGGGKGKFWLDSLDATPGACGIMYTTWLDKYELLGPFGDLVSRR